MNDQTERHEDILNEATLVQAMADGCPAPRLSFHTVIDSTNAEAKRILLADETAPTLVVAEQQTAGRGRMGRSFYSPAQTGAYFSVAYVTPKPPESVVTVTGATAVAVMRAIRRLSGVQTKIKWVNDLYLDNKKVCGILAESIYGAWNDGLFRLIIGIGINLNTCDFPGELLGKAGSLHLASVTRAELIAAVWQELMPMLESLEDRSWLDDYRIHSTVLHQRIGWVENDQKHVGYAEEIDDDGALLVRDERGNRFRLFTGEISLITDPSAP